MMPFAKKNHDSRIQRRVIRIQRVSNFPLSSADMAKANGIVNAVNPKYSVGG